MSRAVCFALAFLLVLDLSPAIAQAQEDWVGQQPYPTQSGHGHLVRDRAGNVIMATLYGAVTKFRASDGAVLWTANAGTYGRLAIDSSDNVYTSTNITTFNRMGQARANLVVTKISPSGSTIWTAQQDIGPVSEHSSAGPIVLGTNGSLYALGTSGNASQPTAPATLVRWSISTGAFQSMVSLGGVPDYGGDMQLNALTLDSSNNVYWASPSGLSRYSSTLNGTPIVWTGGLEIRGIAVSGSSVFVTGSQFIGGSEYEMYVAKLASGNLSTTWKYAFPGQFRNSTYPGSTDICYPQNYTTFGGNAIAVDASGNVYAAGDAVNVQGSFVGGTYAKLDSTGHLLWSRQVGQNGLDSACFDIAVDTNGKLVVTCTDMQLGNESSTAIAVISDQNGNLLEWFSNDGPGGEDDAFDHVVIGSSGTLYLLDEAGYPNGYGGQYFVPTIFAYTATGL